MTTRFSPLLFRIAGLLAVAVASAAVAVVLTPRLWLASTLLGPVSDHFEAERTVGLARGGKVIGMLASDSVFLALFDIEEGPEALAAVSAVIDREVTVVAGPQGVWIVARDSDGARAKALVRTMAETTAVVETEDRERDLLRLTEKFAKEASDRRARIEALFVDASPKDDVVASEVHQARIREAVARLAEVEENLAECHARAEVSTLPWTVEETAGSDLMLLPRRFGPAVAAAVAIPLLLVVGWLLVTGRVQDS